METGGPKFNTRYDCQNQKCSRMFMSSDTVSKVKCPHCNYLNVFREEPEPELPSWVAPEVPIYTLDEASQVAKNYLDEDPERTEGWEKVAVTYEGIESAWTKAIAANLTREFVYCTKVTGYINATINQIFDCYWNPKGEMTWNTASVTAIKVLEDKGAEQQVLIQLKKKSFY